MTAFQEGRRDIGAEYDYDEPEPWYVNEYEASRAYGGPEEGGWWYDTGRFIACHGITPSREEADRILHRDVFADYVRRQNESQYATSSVLCDGWTIIRLEHAPGANYPGEQPHYE